MPYLGNHGDNLIKSFKKKLRRYLKPEKKIEIKILYKTTSISLYTNLKDKTNFLSKSGVVYKFCCPGCGQCYVGKTDRTMHERTYEHANTKTAVNIHIEECTNYHYLSNLQTIGDEFIVKKEFDLNQIRNNIVIIDQSNNWLQLLYKEALAIKKENPVLNVGLKATKELQLF